MDGSVADGLGDQTEEAKPTGGQDRIGEMEMRPWYSATEAIGEKAGEGRTREGKTETNCMGSKDDAAAKAQNKMRSLSPETMDCCARRGEREFWCRQTRSQLLAS